jgi:Chaperone of endosialidase
MLRTTWTTVVAASLMLAACSTTSQVEQINAQRAAQDRECQSKGYKPGTQDYQTCLQVVAMNQSAVNGMATSAALLPLTVLGAFISDVRLKRDIAEVGQLPSGIRVYRFKYLWSEQVFVGVLAQEVVQVAPEAVIRGGDGYFRVNYRRLGTRLLTWEEWTGPKSTAQVLD